MVRASTCCSSTIAAEKDCVPRHHIGVADGRDQALAAAELVNFIEL